ncbi:MAG: hypothetical protein RLZ12_410 [Bacillota bacterium]|jgi:CDP-glucose 4,6-dehydratase
MGCLAKVEPNFWAGKRVFLTGESGFKGGWLTLWLLSKGAEVFGYSKGPVAEPAIFDILKLKKKCAVKIGDVADSAALSAAMKSFKPDLVMHLAAQSLVRESYRDPLGTVASNVLGTANLLEAVRRVTSARVALVVTTDKCYKQSEQKRAFIEEDPLGGADLYSASKACAELVTEAYTKSFMKTEGYQIAAVRAGNVVGGGDFANDRLIPDLMRELIFKQPCAIRMPEAVRPWQHIFDVLRGYLVLAQELWADEKYSGAWNFGPPAVGLSVGEVAKEIYRLWGTNQKTKTSLAKLHEATYLHIDSTKANKQLGWEMKLSMTERLRWTVDWYQAYARGEEMAAYSLKQLKKYEELK